ncbi:MAG: hypothetical protein QOD77_1100 [Thermoplasmata archaeon]|nr:hypothetical protein [Thermoplasmata archaeon]
MPRLGAAAAALLLLLPFALPLAAAAEAPVVRTVQVAGTAAVEAVPQLLDARAGPGPNARLEMSARRWTVVAVERATMNVADLWRNDESDPRTTASTWEGDLEAVPWMDGARLFVTALPGGASLAGSFQSAHVGPPESACMARPSHFLGHDPGPCVPLGPTHVVESLDEVLSLRWTGPVRVQLWGWNVTGEAGASWSGAAQRPWQPGVPAYDETVRVVTLMADQAELRFTLPGHDTSMAWLASDWDVTGTIVVEDALAGTVTQLTGDHAMAFGARDGDALPLAFAAPARPPDGLAASGWTGLGATVLVLLGTLAAALAAWRRSRPRTDLEDLLDAPDPATAAARAGHSPRAGKQATILRTIAFIRSRQPDAAEAVLQAQQGADPLDTADHAFLLACIRALQGRAQEAAAAVRACLAASPSYAVEVRGTPILRGLMEAGAPGDAEGYA